MRFFALVSRDSMRLRFRRLGVGGCCHAQAVSDVSVDVNGHCDAGDPIGNFFKISSKTCAAHFRELIPEFIDF